MAPPSTRKKQAKRSRKSSATNQQDLQALREWLLPDAAIFSILPFHGNSKWKPQNLVWLALCWAWSDQRFVTDAFIRASEACQTLLGVLPVNTYQGLRIPGHLDATIDAVVVQHSSTTHGADRR